MLLTFRFVVPSNDFLQEETEGTEFVNKAFSLLSLFPPIINPLKNWLLLFSLRPYAALGPPRLSVVNISLDG